MGDVATTPLFFLGTDFADDTVFGFFVVVAENQAPDFLLRTILRRGKGHCILNIDPAMRGIDYLRSKDQNTPSPDGLRGSSFSL